MNIFYVNKDPIQSAIDLVDSHVVKMILETCQLLSTAHRLLDGTKQIVLTKDKYITVYDEYDRPLPVKKLIKGGRKKTIYVLPDSREVTLYQATHVNHPSSVWCRQNVENYQWLHNHLMALLNEYTYRYGKVHKCTNVAVALYQVPNNILPGKFTDPTPAMDKKYLIENDAFTDKFLKKLLESDKLNEIGEEETTKINY